MKSKGEKIAFVAAIILLILYIVIAVSALVFGIKFFKEKVLIVKDSITSEKFVSIMNEEGFEVAEITEDVEDVKAKKAYKAENGNYTIEFYEFENERDSRVFFIENGEKNDSNTSTKKISISGNNYNTFTIVKNGRFFFMERIDKTIIIVDGYAKYEEASKNLLKSFGY